MGSTLKETERLRRYRAWAAARSDGEAARRLGITKVAFCRWRKKERLPTARTRFPQTHACPWCRKRLYINLLRPTTAQKDSEA